MPQHESHKSPSTGVTWLRPTSWGVTWLTAACFAVIAVLATGVAIVPAPAATDSALSTSGAADVGIMGTSMVEMLANESGKGALPLETLRELILANMAMLELAPVDTLTTTTTTTLLPGTFALSPSTDLVMEPIVALPVTPVFGDGSGIDVALIDTGIAPVDGLNSKNKVLHGPDLSFEGASADAAFLDTFGHGTHMAGIIAGDRVGARGIAPGARLVSVKVAGHDGITTVPQVIAAIDWVVEHRDTDGLNIRVLNLSLGQQGVSKHVGDALSAAVERAWDAGIFVVVAAGNDGDVQAHLDSPAIDPYVLAVGAMDTVTNPHMKLWDVPGWSGLGDGVRNPDVVAPAVSVASYRVPGSTVDVAAPWAQYGEDFFKGSGTSQAAAALSGVAAVMLSTNPRLTNNDLKATLRDSANILNLGEAPKSGEGFINVATGLANPLSGKQRFEKAAGPGTGITTPRGDTWTGGSWTDASWNGATWSGATWSGATWSGATWSGATWSGATWSGATWSGATWSGATWSGATWSGATWSGATWSGTGWVNQ